MHQGVERSYLIRTPDESVMRNGPVPLVLVLHGGGGNAENAEQMTGFTEKARKEGFIVVYPEGQRPIQEQAADLECRPLLRLRHGAKRGRCGIRARADRQAD